MKPQHTVAATAVSVVCVRLSGPAFCLVKSAEVQAAADFMSSKAQMAAISTEDDNV